MFRFIAALTLVLAAAAAQAQPRQTFACTTDVGPRDVEVGSGTVEIAAEAPAGDAAALWSIEEQGRDLEWSAATADFDAIDARPPRLGLLAVPASRFPVIRLRQSRRAVGAAHARVRLVCEPDARFAQLPACIDRARALLADESPLDPADVFPEDACGALLAQAAATRASRRSQPAQSLEFYERAARLWSAADDAPRSAAAVLGATEQLLRLGRFGDAVERAGAAAELNRVAGNEYFALRAESERCLAQSELGGGTSTFECMRALPSAFEALGEINEAANTWFNLAEMAADDGDVAAQQVALTAASRLDPSFVDPLVRGRLSFAQSALAISEGRIGAAIEALDAALRAFEEAGDERWQANVQLAVASLYERLGSTGEALLFVEEALSRLSEEQAPQRLAVALRLRARLHAAQGELDAAGADIRRARELFERLHMPLSVAETALDEREWGIGAAAAATREALPAAAALPPRLAFRAGRLLAEEALAQRRFAEVDAFLAGVGEDRLAMFDRFDVRVLGARLDRLRGNAVGAQRSVEHSIEWLRGIVATARASALRRIVARRLRDLRALWLEAWSAQAEASRPDVSQLWTMLGRTHAEAALAVEADEAAVPSATSAFDRQLAQDLLQPDDVGVRAEAAAQRRLFERYARDQAAIAGDARLPLFPPLPQLQRALPDDAVLLAFAFGESRGYALALSKEAATIHPIDSPASIRAAVRRLFAVLDGPARPAAEIEQAARGVGEALLPAGLPLPRRLLVLADDELAAVPYSLLPWPGHTPPLVDTTDISVVSLPLASAAAAAGVGEPAFDVLIASAGSNAGPLPALPTAEREATLIQHALPQSRVNVLRGAALDRSTMTQALRRAGARVHVAAHGFRRPGFEGYAGIWLQGGSVGAAPELLSWLDFADARLGAQLVVLDVCQLAAQTDLVSAGTSSFAGALSAAGVANVVAASWPISDAAAALWVPEFYAEMHSTAAADVAHALRAAQLRLRDSRMFRHPYYWASLTHLQRGVEAP